MKRATDYIESIGISAHLRNNRARDIKDKIANGEGESWSATIHQHAGFITARTNEGSMKLAASMILEAAQAGADYEASAVEGKQPARPGASEKRIKGSRDI